MKTNMTALLMVISISLCFLLSSCGTPTYSGEVVAVVNGQKIYSEQVEDRILFNTIQNVANYEIVSALYATEEERETAYNQTYLAEDEEGVIEELIKGEVFRQYLKKSGDDISYKEAINACDLSWELMKTNETSQTTYEWVTYAIDEHDLTVEQYLELLYASQYNELNVSIARSQFIGSEDFDVDSSVSQDDQVAAFEQSVMEKATIERF